MVEWTPAEREALRALPFADEAFRHETGASVLGVGQGFSTLERLWARPTCEVNGLLSGYTARAPRR